MHTAFFIDLAMIIAGYIFLAISLFGTGCFFSRVLKIRVLSESGYFPLTWLGWAINLTLLQVLNIFFPINVFSSLPIMIFGLISAFLYFKKDFRNGLTPSLTRIYLILLTIAVLWVATLSMHTPTHYDSGLYHFTSIRWLNESPIVLGLGNLHGRLAFNQSFFSFVAYLNAYPLFNHGPNIANGFLLVLLMAEFLVYPLKRIFLKTKTATPSVIDLTAIFLIPVIVYWMAYGQLASPSPDLASSILQILLFFYFINALSNNPTAKNGFSQIAFILIMSATAITVKLSNSFYILSICIILLLKYLKSRHESPKHLLRVILKLIAVPTLIISIWMLRGILLSGCPAYPSTVGCVNTQWSMPIESVKSEATWIYSWARLPELTPDLVLSSWEWVTPWFERVVLGNITKIIYPLVIFVIFTVASSVLYFSQPKLQKANRHWFFAPIPALVGILFWFLLAPDLRFAHSLFWILPIAAAVALLSMLVSSGKFSFLISMVMFLSMTVNIAYNLRPNMLINISSQGIMPAPVVDLIEQTTFSGLKVVSPTEKDQCWDSKIPCTPYFNPELYFVDNPIFPKFAITLKK